MAETFTYDNSPETEVLTDEEQDSLAVGSELMEQQDNLLAGKYKNAEDLESAYIELQRKLGGDSDDGDEGMAEEDTEESDEEGSVAAEMLSSASQEFYENGELSQETFDALSEMSSGELLETYMSMQPEPATDLTGDDVSDLKASVGGEEAYNQITNWAASSLDDVELDAFNATIDSGTPAQIKMIMAGLQARYQQENGYEGTQVQGKPPSSSGEGFRSQAEVVKAISDPRYDRDPAYRNDVLMKLERSDVDF